MKIVIRVTLIISIVIYSCMPSNKKSDEQLLRKSYISTLDNSEREYFLYLPKGYEESEKKWPILMFLHGNGERGNGKSELDYVQIHGPLYEAWIQKRDLPFIIISPQLHMFDINKKGISYIDNRTPKSIPKRLNEGVPKRPKPRFTVEKLTSFVNDSISKESTNYVNKYGWNNVHEDLIKMIKTKGYPVASYYGDPAGANVQGQSGAGDMEIFRRSGIKAISTRDRMSRNIVASVAYTRGFFESANGVFTKVIDIPSTISAHYNLKFFSFTYHNITSYLVYGATTKTISTALKHFLEP